MVMVLRHLIVGYIDYLVNHVRVKQDVFERFC